MKSGGTGNYLIGLIFLVMIVGLVLRYGKSSDALAQDINKIFATLTLQNSGTNYYGP